MRLLGLALTVVAVATLTLVGCGGDAGTPKTAAKPAGPATAPAAARRRAKQDPRELIGDVKAALQAVKSYHVVGTFDDKDGRGHIVADVTAAGAARVTMQVKPTTVRFTVTGGFTYLKAPASFWRKEGDNATERDRLGRAFGGRWVKVPTDVDDDLAGPAKQLSPRELAFCTDKDLGTLTNKGLRTVGGRLVVVLHDAGDKPGTQPSDLQIAATGPALPLRERTLGPRKAGGSPSPRCGHDDASDRKTDASTGNVTISRFNAIPPIVPPPNALDLQRQSGPGGDAPPA